MTEIALLDLFSGIGGFSIGLERAGFTTRAFVEIDPYCQAVLRHRFPGVYIHDDVRTITAESLRTRGIDRIDAICGGFPCQDLSVAGKRAGLAGERSGLWFEYVRIIREFRPRVVIVENVPGLLSAGFGQVLGDLATLGYDAWWDCIPASAVGAPHRRDRVWVVAYAASGGTRRDGERPAREVQPVGAKPGEANADANSQRRERGGFPEHAREQGAPGSEPDGLREGRRRKGKAVANTDGRRPEAAGDGGGDRSTGGDREAGVAGGGGPRAADVADTARQRVEGNGPGGQQEPRAPVKKRVPRRDRTEFPDADPAMCEGAVEHGDQGGIPGPADEGGRRSEPGLGGMADGVSRGLHKSGGLQK